MAEPDNTWPGANKLLGPPDGVDETSVSRLAVFSNRVACVSCWQLSDAEIVRTRRVFVSVMFGGMQPPVYIGTEVSVRDLMADWGVWRK